LRINNEARSLILKYCGDTIGLFQLVKFPTGNGEALI